MVPRLYLGAGNHEHARHVGPAVVAREGQRGATSVVARLQQRFGASRSRRKGTDDDDD